jgi:hypothetical protein
MLSAPPVRSFLNRPSCFLTEPESVFCFVSGKLARLPINAG